MRVVRLTTLKPRPGSHTSYGVSKDGRRGTPRGAADLAYLDALWKWDGTGDNARHARERGERPPRLWVVIARDVHNTWRVREVRTYTAEMAVAKYNNIFNYEVVGVGLLGGSGHPVQWMRDGCWNA